tara:strand:+ start:1257 stop:1802 length:546 start_codon:yes stop_codon:yes gene_type:complete
MAEVIDIVNGISQVMANTYDGALDENGEPIKTGLKREEDVAITDRRVMDGFKVKMVGDQLHIKYHGEVTMTEAHGDNFETDLSQMIADIASYLKKEYKKVTGSALKLEKQGDIEAIVQSVGAHRNWVQATCVYTLGGLGEAVEGALQGSDEDRLDKSIRSWLELGPSGKAKNDKRPATKED